MLLKLNRFLLILIVFCFSCNKKNHFAGVTKDNLEEKIHEAYLEAETNYTTKAAVPVL
jgi:glutathionyl-hydroquinone reductase